MDCSSLVRLEAASLEATFELDCSREIIAFVEPALVAAFVEPTLVVAFVEPALVVVFVERTLVVASMLAIASEEQDPFL